MGLEILDGGTLRVSASYSLKVPGSVPFSSEDAYFAFSLEAPIDDLDVDAILEQAADLATALESGVKVMVFSELGIAFTSEEGVLRPVITVTDVPVSNPTPRAGGRPASGNTAAKATAARSSAPDDRPTIQADLGLGLITYLDNRPKKALGPEAGGFKSGAADFRSKDKVNDGRYHSVWTHQKGENGQQGTPNADVVKALEAAGVSV
jgi:hypothetical protein